MSHIRDNGPLRVKDVSELLCIWMHQALCEGCRREVLLVSARPRATEPVSGEFDSL